MTGEMRMMATPKKIVTKKRLLMTISVCLIDIAIIAIAVMVVDIYLDMDKEVYGPHPPTRIEKLEAENVAIRARLTELERNQGACPW
ncbi:hypothetical protein LCGC14_2595540 [marine sediment metagenome]|uniref:Uncharacterized protein n=1 Tax=marine sediment metagenome TaxID=412755 RepID=A0A0F9D309_9ZZZZ